MTNVIEVFNEEQINEKLKKQGKDPLKERLGKEKPI